MNRPSYRLGILITTVSAFLGRGLTLATGIILAKILLPETLGKFFSDQALVFIGIGLINLGVGHGYRQIVSRNPELRNSYILPVILIRIAAMTVYLAGVTVYLHSVSRLNIQTLTVVCAVLLFQTLELFQIDLQIVRNYSKVSVLNICSGMVLLLAAVLCWKTDANYNILVYSYLFLTFLLVILGWLLVKPKYAAILTFDYRTLFRTSIPFSASILAYWFTNFWGLTYIKDILGAEHAGYYSIPLKFYQVALVLAMSINSTTLPLFHKLAVTKCFDTYANVFQRITRGLWITGVPLVGICFFIPDVLIKTFATEKYMAAAPIFPWIGLAMISLLIAIPAGNLLESIDKQWYRVAIQSIGAIICLLLVIFLVPAYGIRGAAWTLLLINLWVILGFWFMARHFMKSLVPLRELFIPYIVMVALIAVISNCPDFSKWLKLLIFVAGWLLYAAMFLNLKKEVLGMIKVFYSDQRQRD